MDLAIVRILLSISLLFGVLAADENSGPDASNATSGKIDPKIVGGQAVDISTVPYTVSIRLTANDRRSYGSGHLCGGVVISQRLVATAAHCCYNSDTKKYRTAGEYFLVMGSSTLRTKTANTQEYYVQQLIIHADYNHNTLTNDIALMFINGYIPWNSPTVRALALNTGIVSTGTVCTISGWGVLYSSGYSSNSLQAASVPIVTYESCRSAYEVVPISQVCAGYAKGGVDACQGDSGGPLNCNNQLAGIVSYGTGCALAGYPGVYTNVSYYNSWIVQQNSSFNYSVYRNTAGPLGSSSKLWWLPLALAFVLATGGSSVTAASQ
ncbi:trypsin eta isoform X2 [Drosophila serrata]|uniref:trypsin eta isoform X2 n=1 Tax=Drosophila serrata TaxID=7274 RepID=UPI000A1D0F4A|nr:trypsin eta isoform X2 [Drosophila serrata]